MSTQPTHVESWQDLYRRSYWEQRKANKEFWAAARKSLKIRVLVTPHGTIHIIEHDLFRDH